MVVQNNYLVSFSNEIAILNFHRFKHWQGKYEQLKEEIKLVIQRKCTHTHNENLFNENSISKI